MNLALVTSTLDLPDRPFAASELGALAIDRRKLRAAIESGEVRRPFRGVFVPPDVADSQEVRAAALARVVSLHHVVCDRSAAWIHGVETFAVEELEQVPPVEACALRGHAPTRLDTGVDARTRDLTPEDIVTVGGIRVTTPLRTALDLGCHLRRREAMAALNEFARLHDLTRDRLADHVARFAGRRGVRQLRELVPMVDGRMESQRESWVMLAIRDANLPTPEAQVWVEVDGIPTYRLDFAYRLARVAIEYDGEDFHHTEEQKRHDAERRAWLEAHGWTIIVVRKGDFTGADLDRWLREIKDALRPTYTTRRW